MKKILFHDNMLCERGTSIALYDYAKYNEELLGNESYICYNSTHSGNNLEVVQKFTNRFPNRIIPYENFHQDKDKLNDFCVNYNITHCYFIKSGEYDGKVLSFEGCFNLIHAVFQTYEPHGNKYAYVSQWLSDAISHRTKQPQDYVPHIIKMLPSNKNIRKNLNIPMDAIVIGRHGGKDQFNINFVQEAVIEYADTNLNCYFLFVNTERFCEHPRIIFLDIIIDEQHKSNFIDSCDAMIHGRSMGESFGLAICEFLYHNKPVFAFNGGNDQHHVKLLTGTPALYNSKEDLLNKFNMITSEEFKNIKWSQLIDEFNPNKVMKQFTRIFLS